MSSSPAGVGRPDERDAQLHAQPDQPARDLRATTTAHRSRTETRLGHRCSPLAPSTVEFENGGLGNSAEFYGGINYDFPQGRRVAGYQVIDDASYTRGRNTIRFGYNIRRDNITDIQGVETTNPVSSHLAKKTSSPVSRMLSISSAFRCVRRSLSPSITRVGTLKMSFKLTPGAHPDRRSSRAETELEPDLPHQLLLRCSQTPSSQPTGTVVRPPTFPTAQRSRAASLIAGKPHQAFKGYQSYALMPRLGINYQFSSKTTVRAGFRYLHGYLPGL